MSDRPIIRKIKIYYVVNENIDDVTITSGRNGIEISFLRKDISTEFENRCKKYCFFFRAKSAPRRVSNTTIAETHFVNQTPRDTSQHIGYTNKILFEIRRRFWKKKKWVIDYFVLILPPIFEIGYFSTDSSLFCFAAASSSAVRSHDCMRIKNEILKTPL